MPMRVRVTAGSLPPGLEILAPGDGRIVYLKGQARVGGSYSWTLTATDDEGSTSSNTYSMTVGSRLEYGGLIFQNNGRLPSLTKDNSFNIQNQLFIEELGVTGSTFTVSVVSGTKPAWLTISTGTVTNETGITGPVATYCYAAIDFSGTPADVVDTNFTIRVTSSTGVSKDLQLNVVAASNIVVVRLARSYGLSASKSHIAEGEQVTFNFLGTGFNNGDTIPYVIVGVSAADINQPLSGVLTLTNVTQLIPITGAGGPTDDTISGYRQEEYQTASITITALADLSTESAETLTLALIASDSNFNDTTQASVIINDTSIAPINPTFNLAASSGSIQEGSSVIFTLTTTDVSQNTTFAFTLDGVSTSDILINGVAINQLNKLIRIDGSGIGQVTITARENSFVDPKTLTLRIPAQGLLTTPLSASVSITDSPSTFSLLQSATIISEGESVTFTLATTSIADGTTFTYLIQGVTSGDVDKPLTGTLTVQNNLAGITIEALSDQVTEDPVNNENMLFSIPQLGLSKFVQIRDISFTPPPTVLPQITQLQLYRPNFSAVDASTPLTEGDTFYLSIYGNAQAIGTKVRYLIEGIQPNDISIPLSQEVTLTRVNYFAVEYAESTQLVTSFKNTTNSRRTVRVSLPDYPGLVVTFDLVSAVTSTDPPPGTVLPGPPDPVVFFDDTRNDGTELRLES